MRITISGVDTAGEIAQLCAETTTSAAEAMVVLEQFRVGNLRRIKIRRDGEELDERHLQTLVSLERKIAGR